MALGNLDPLAMPGGVLKGGVNPLDYAAKRNAWEDQMGTMLAQHMQQSKLEKAKLDANKEAENAKLLNTTLTDLNKLTVFAPHAQRWASEAGAFTKELGNKIMLNKNGKGGDPMDLSSPEGQWMHTQLARLHQMVDNSKQNEKQYESDNQWIRDHPNDYEPGTLDANAKLYADPNNMIEGKIPASLAQFFKYEDYLNANFDKVLAEKTARAGLTPEGGVSTYTATQRRDSDLLDAAMVFAAHPHAPIAAQERYDALPPLEQKRIADLAKAKGVTIPVATMYDYGRSHFGAKQETRGLTSPSESAAGAQNTQAGLSWVAEVSKGIEEGTYDGTQQDVFAGLDLFKHDPVKTVKQGDYYTVFNNFVLKKGKKIDPDSNQQVSNNQLVNGIRYDPATNMYSIKVKTEDGGDLPTLKVTKGQFVSEVLPEITGNNPDYIKGIGGVINITDKRYKKFQGTGGQDVLGSKGRKSGALNLTAGELD